MECHFYGVYIPNDLNINNDRTNVFTNKLEALRIVKEQKKARFKVFRTREEAEEFALNGSEQLLPEPTIPPPITKPPNNAEFKFRGPSPQALVQFRKLIENDNLMMVKQTVWDNPRYLISSGDTPSILKEGPRYNALHVAAIAKNAKMCELILNTVSDINFMILSYGDYDYEMCEDRANKLLDLYLNTPDKGLNETPLHLAVKFGAADCVDVLAAYPTCDRNLRNKNGDLPREMICQRLSQPDQEIVRRITAALAPLEEQYYVPVVRSDDDTLIPEIGIPFNVHSPPKLNDDPLSPRVNVYALAGPMEISAAQSFRKKWKTPPRLISTRKEEQTSFRKILNDSEKGLERIGRELAHQYEIGWKEFWPFLNTFIDLNTTEGLNMLEKHLETKYQSSWESKQEIEEERKPPDNNNIISPMSDLCRIFENCKITESSALQTEKPFLCVTKSLQDYATRIYHVLRKRSLDSLKSEIRHLISLVSSYKSDNGFAKIPFEFVHLRIGEIVGEKFTREDGSFEMFESLDQNGNADIVNEHINCILRYIRKYVKGENSKWGTEEECKVFWSQGGESCKCSWAPDDTFRKKRTRSLNSDRCRFNLNEPDIRPRRLLFEDDDLVASPDDILSDSSSEDEDEQFFTPPTSPDISVSEDLSEDEMMDTMHNSNFDVFLEENHPTKTDADVYYAIRKNPNITSDMYPNIYRWRHTIDLYSEVERERWQNFYSKECYQSPIRTPSKSKSWLQLTGLNSPISSPIRTPPATKSALITPIKSLKKLRN